MKCDKECQPVEQIRGEMKPGDYYDVIASNFPGMPGAVPEPEKYGIPIYNGDVGDNNPSHCVEMNDDMKENFRICCKTCGRATPWGAQDIPGMPGAGADWTRKKWMET